MRRKRPYTERGISRVPCFRCDRPSQFQWQICADDNTFRGLCTRCDVALNRMVLRWAGDPEWRVKMARYERREA